MKIMQGWSLHAFCADQNIENFVMHGVLSFIGTLDVK